MLRIRKSGNGCNIRALHLSYMKRPEEAAFLEAYDQYADAIFRYLAFRIYDRDRARELMQETFTKAWEYIRTGKEIEQYRPFLYRVAHNLSVNEALRTKPLSIDALYEDGSYDPADSAARSPEEEAEVQEVLRALSALSDEEQSLMTLRYIEGLPVKEIAKLLGVPPNTVSVRIHRALARLRESLQP